MDGGAVGIAGGDRGYDRGVCDAEVLQAADLQPVGDVCLAATALPAGADRMVGGRAEIGGGELLVCLERRARAEFPRRTGLERRRGDDTAR